MAMMRALTILSSFCSSMRDENGVRPALMSWWLRLVTDIPTMIS
jgi:hypothetical protein